MTWRAFVRLIGLAGLALSACRGGSSADVEIYAGEPLPERVTVFLGGCTRKPPAGEPRDVVLGVQGSWRQEAIRRLRAAGVRGPIVVPEARDGARHGEREANARWERQAIRRSAVVLFWVPVGGEFGAGFTTRGELGWAVGLGKRVAFGAPVEAPDNHFGAWWLRSLVEEVGFKTAYDLAATCVLAAAK